jgi:signal transduction histidine kinase
MYAAEGIHLARRSYASDVVQVIDSGLSFRPENLNRIFNHGFTTKKDSHEFGLHNSSHGAGAIGGSLTVQSDGRGRGATFTLELAIHFRAGM